DATGQQSVTQSEDWYNRSTCGRRDVLWRVAYSAFYVAENLFPGLYDVLNNVQFGQGKVARRYFGRPHKSSKRLHVLAERVQKVVRLRWLWSGEIRLGLGFIFWIGNLVELGDVPSIRSIFVWLEWAGDPHLIQIGIGTEVQ